MYIYIILSFFIRIIHKVIIEDFFAFWVFYFWNKVANSVIGNFIKFAHYYYVGEYTHYIYLTDTRIGASLKGDHNYYLCNCHYC